MDDSTIKSARRTLNVFEVFADLRRPARVGELYRRLDLPQSSTSKLLKLFAKMGYLQYDSTTRTYFPTLRVTLLGSWLHDLWFGQDSLLATMDSLREALGTSVLLGIQNDKHVLYMTTMQATMYPRPPLLVGTLRPICLASVGKALMMGKTDHDIGLLVRRINSEEPNSALHIRLADFLEDMQVCRARGFALSNGAVVPGTNVVAMPLPSLPGQPLMALGVGAPLEWVDSNLEKMVEALREKIATITADAMERQASGTPPSPIPLS